MNELVVWLADQRIGWLIRKDNGNLQFRYDAGYDGPALSQALPVQPQAHGHVHTHAVFGGLLPEGEGRATLARIIGVSEQNDYGLLAEVGGDCAGAVVLLSEGQAPAATPRTRMLDEDQLADMLAGLPERPLAADPGEGIRLSLAGAQPKVPVIVQEDGRMALPRNSAAPTTHIIKPEPLAFPGLVDNETYCMALARACQLSVAAVRKGATAHGLPYLVVARYDRDLASDPIRRLHQEDFCQALSKGSEHKYQDEGGPTFVDIKNLVYECTPTPAREGPRLVQALAFNWIIGNCDAHGKNYSLLYDRGAPTLAPLYDLVSTVLYGQLRTRLAMSIGGAANLEDVDERAWRKLAQQARMREAWLVGTVRDLLDTAKQRSAALRLDPEHDNPSAHRIDERIQRLTL